MHLSAKRVRVIEEFTAETADGLWAEHLDNGQIEWMSAVVNRLPMMVVAKLAGLPEGDVDKLIRHGYATTTTLDGIVTPDQLQVAGMAAMELSAHVLEHFEKANAGTDPGLIADLAGRYASGEVEQLPGAGDHAHALQCGGRIDRVAFGQRRAGAHRTLRGATANLMASR